MCKIESAIKFAEKVIGYTWNHFDVHSFIRRKCSLPKNVPNFGDQFSQTQNVNHNKAFVGLLLAKAAGVGDEALDLSWSLIRGPGILPKQYLLAETLEMLLWCSEHNNDSNSFIVNYVQNEAFNNLISIDNSSVYNSMQRSIANSLKCNSSQLTFNDLKGIKKEEIIIKMWESLVFSKSAAISANGYSSMLALAKHSSKMQQKAFNFGKLFTFATKLDEEIDSNYIYCKQECLNFNLPFLLYLHSNPDLINVFEERKHCSFTAYKVHNELSKTVFLSKSRKVLQSYVCSASSQLKELEDSRAKEALSNVLAAINV